MRTYNFANYHNNMLAHTHTLTRSSLEKEKLRRLFVQKKRYHPPVTAKAVKLVLQAVMGNC